MSAILLLFFLLSPIWAPILVKEIMCYRFHKKLKEMTRREKLRAEFLDRKRVDVLRVMAGEVPATKENMLYNIETLYFEDI